MRLLYDENLSSRLPARLAAAFADSGHVSDAPTREIEALLLAWRERIESFAGHPENALLVVEP